MSEIKKIGDIIPDGYKPVKSDRVAIIKNEKELRDKNSAEILKVFSTLEIPQKYKAINNQIKNMEKTSETVVMAGRVKAKDEPEVLYLMIEHLLQFAGISNQNAANGILDVMIESYGWMALQDFALFFRKIKAGHYGEVYGKMNGMWITGKIKNFQQSIQFHLAVDREAEHFARKQDDGCRGLESYYDDVKPEIFE